MAGDAPLVVGHEADEPTRQARLLLPNERVAADEIALRQLHEPAEVRLERRRRVVDVVAVERHPHLEPQRVAGAESGWRDPSRADERLPDRRRITIVEVQLEAILPRVARPRDDARRTRDLALDEMVVADLSDIGSREVAQNLGGLWSLQRKERDLVAPVLELGVESR